MFSLTSILCFLHGYVRCEFIRRRGVLSICVIEPPRHQVVFSNLCALASGISLAYGLPVSVNPVNPVNTFGGDLGLNLNNNDLFRPANFLSLGSSFSILVTLDFCLFLVVQSYDLWLSLPQS